MKIINELDFDIVLEFLYNDYISSGGIVSSKKERESITLKKYTEMILPYYLYTWTSIIICSKNSLEQNKDKSVLNLEK